MEEKNEIMEHLRATLLRDIELQENVRGILKKMLKRYTIILITVSAVFVLLLGMILYVVRRPVSQTEIVLRNMQELSGTFVNQIKFLREERKDAAIARKDFVSGNARLDSIIKAQDSIIQRQDSIIDKRLDIEYKKLMKR